LENWVDAAAKLTKLDRVTCAMAQMARTSKFFRKGLAKNILCRQYFDKFRDRLPRFLREEHANLSRRLEYALSA
jgi:hypothetical protein